jgi:hypothetical protein
VYLIDKGNVKSWFVAGFPPWRPGFASGQHVGFVVDNAALGQVFSEYFGFLCQSFHQFLHYHNHPELAQYAIGGRNAEWSPIGLNPTLYQLKIYTLFS